MACNSINPDTVQKHIQKQIGVSSSLYTMNFSMLNRTINNNNEGVKHNSYHRYLLNKKGKMASKLSTITSHIPIKGNKTRAFTISSYNNNCSCE